MEVGTGIEGTVQPAAARAPESFRFTGSGGEYFGIWIVNLLLTLVTLGIYSPWAKVRRLQYFYRHTEVAGSSFDFHGKPLAILLGRIIALTMFFAYNYSVRTASPLTLVVLAAIAVGMPWLLRNSFRFRLYNSSWRGLRFSFRGDVGEAYQVFLLFPLLTFFTLYIMAPFTHQRIKAYEHNNAWLGQTRFSFHASAGRFYLIYLIWLVAIVAFIAIMVAAGSAGLFGAFAEAAKHKTKPDMHAMIMLFGVIYGALIALALLVGPVYQALLANLVWNNTRIGEHRFECAQSPFRLAWILIGNFVLVVLTLGFFMPWAMVRLARYRTECMRLLPATDLQEFVAGDSEAVSAVGVETAAAFDIDIAL